MGSVGKYIYNYRYIIVLIVFGILIFFKYRNEEKNKEHSLTNPKEFRLPEIPTILTKDAERMEFLAAHYWQNFDFSDTYLITRPDITEKAYAEFLEILQHTTLSSAKKDLQKMMRSAEADSAMYAYFMSLNEKYLYEPNSPFRNEDFYITVLHESICSSRLSELDKTRPKYQLDVINRNRVGMKAATFPELDKTQGDYIILFFFNPECEECNRIKDYIKESKLNKYAKVVAVNPDKDKNFDKLYDLRAIPTLYLLSSEKTVLMKDVAIENIDSYLKDNADKI